MPFEEALEVLAVGYCGRDSAGQCWNSNEHLCLQPLHCCVLNLAGLLQSRRKVTALYACAGGRKVYVYLLVGGSSESVRH